jgi:hypothetical protein
VRVSPESVVEKSGDEHHHTEESENRSPRGRPSSRGEGGGQRRASSTSIGAFAEVKSNSYPCRRASQGSQGPHGKSNSIKPWRPLPNGDRESDHLAAATNVGPPTVGAEFLHSPVMPRERHEGQFLGFGQRTSKCPTSIRPEPADEEWSDPGPRSQGKQVDPLDFNSDPPPGSQIEPHDRRRRFRFDGVRRLMRSLPQTFRKAISISHSTVEERPCTVYDLERMVDEHILRHDQTLKWRATTTTTRRFSNIL